MKPTITRFPDAAAFLSTAEPFLMEQEALNGLMLGAAKASQRSSTSRRRRSPIFALASENGRPVAAAILTNGQKLLLTGMGESMPALAHDLVATHPDLPAVLGPEVATRRFSESWCAITGRVAHPGTHQRLHQAISVSFPVDLPGGRLRAATGDEHDFLSHWQLAFQREAMPREAGDMDAARIITDRLLNDGDLFVWQKDDGWVVSMAARARPTVRGVSINLVYTPPEERRRGHAAACVAHLTQSLLDSGYDFCTLFTDRANATANRLYARIGYNPVADFDEYRFQSIQQP